MSRNAFRDILFDAIAYPMLIVILIALFTCGAAQGQTLSNVDLCNGRNRSTPRPQIVGCTALIKSEVDNTRVLSIAHNNRGNAYTALGQYDVAIQDYDEAIKLNPNYAKPLNNRGVAYEKKGDYDSAIKDFEAAIKIDPSYANAYANLAEIYQKKGEYAPALKDFDDAIRLQPKLGVVWNERCWIRAIVGDLQGALADCNEAIRLEPSAAAFDSRGFTYLKSGQWDSAIADYISALRLDPKLATALYGRGFAKQKKGDLAGGKSDLAAAQTINQNVAEDFARYGLR